MGKFKYSISNYITVSNFTTTDLFDEGFVDSNKSAIDDFIDKRRALFALLRPYESNISETPFELTNMIFLGCISAVESYIRKIIRNIINVDDWSRRNCEGQTLKYGAVLSHNDITMLPEALLEEYSFANGWNIKETISKLIGIKFDKSEPLNTALIEFSKICQLRHCVVHRFGLLGSNNAIELGLSEHKRYLEKPMRIDFDHLNEMVQVCENVVKVINNHLFCEVIERTFVNNTEVWHLDYRRDRTKFKKYFDLFKDSSCPIDYNIVYKEFIRTMCNIYGRGYQQNGHAG